MNANEEMLAGYANPDASQPDADPDAALFEYRFYADTDADLCMRIMSLSCNIIQMLISFTYDIIILYEV